MGGGSWVTVISTGGVSGTGTSLGWSELQNTCTQHNSLAFGSVAVLYTLEYACSRIQLHQYTRTNHRHIEVLMHLRHLHKCL